MSEEAWLLPILCPDIIIIYGVLWSIWVLSPARSALTKLAAFWLIRRLFSFDAPVPSWRIDWLWLRFSDRFFDRGEVEDPTPPSTAYGCFKKLAVSYGRLDLMRSKLVFELEWSLFFWSINFCCINGTIGTPNPLANILFFVFVAKSGLDENIRLFFDWRRSYLLLLCADS